MAKIGSYRGDPDELARVRMRGVEGIIVIAPENVIDEGAAMVVETMDEAVVVIAVSNAGYAEVADSGDRERLHAYANDCIEIGVDTFRRWVATR